MNCHDTTLQTRTRLERPSIETHKPVGGAQTRVHPHLDCPDLLERAKFTLRWGGRGPANEGSAFQASVVVAEGGGGE